MSDLHALIRACKDEPDDDAPRLILADWLDEHGEADRAAFIRRQTCGPHFADEETPKREWLGAWKDWADEYMQENPIGTSRFPILFVRGFMHVSDAYSELFRSLDRILQPPFAWTWVESINFGSWHSGDWTPLFESPNLLALNSLGFMGDGYSGALALPLSVSPNVKNLRELYFGQVGIGDEGALAISQSQSLSRITKLSVDYCDVGPVGIDAIARSEVWDHVRTLNLGLNPMGDEGLTAIACGRLRHALQNLDIISGEYTDDGLRELAISNRLPSLRHLRLGYWDREEGSKSFGAAGLESLLMSPHFENVTFSVFISSPNPLPNSIEQLANVYPDRLRVDYHECTRMIRLDFSDAIDDSGNE